MIEFLEQIDIKYFLWLNSFHSTFWDWFMSAATRREIWLPLYIILLYVIIKNKKTRAVFPILGIILVASLCDFINHDFIKPGVGRWRPFHNEDIQNIIHVFNENRGGRYSFVSSHAANTFGLAIFSSKVIKDWYYRIFIFMWAFITSYSRVYLGFHYPGDMIGGIIFAGIISWIIYMFYKLSTKHLKFGDKDLDKAKYKNLGLVILVGLVMFFCIVAFAYHNTLFIASFERP